MIYETSDWFRKETEEAHLQEVIDMLLNLAVFVCTFNFYFYFYYSLLEFVKRFFTYFNMFTFHKVYVGSTIPWSSLQDVTTEITVWRLIVCAVLILLLRRLPVVLALMKFIPAIKTYREGKILQLFERNS